MEALPELPALKASEEAPRDLLLTEALTACSDLLLACLDRVTMDVPKDHPTYIHALTVNSYALALELLVGGFPTIEFANKPSNQLNVLAMCIANRLAEAFKPEADDEILNSVAALAKTYAADRRAKLPPPEPEPASNANEVPAANDAEPASETHAA